MSPSAAVAPASIQPGSQALRNKAALDLCSPVSQQSPTGEVPVWQLPTAQAPGGSFVTRRPHSSLDGNTFAPQLLVSLVKGGPVGEAVGDGPGGEGLREGLLPHMAVDIQAAVAQGSSAATPKAQSARIILAPLLPRLITAGEGTASSLGLKLVEGMDSPNKSKKPTPGNRSSACPRPGPA